jgi:hypothetical protein
MARSLNALSTGRIQKRKTNLPQITIFGLQRAAGPYRWAKSGHSRKEKSPSLLTQGGRIFKSRNGRPRERA